MATQAASGDYTSVTLDPETRGYATAVQAAPEKKCCCAGTITQKRA